MPRERTPAPTAKEETASSSAAICGEDPEGGSIASSITFRQGGSPVADAAEAASHATAWALTLASRRWQRTRWAGGRRQTCGPEGTSADGIDWHIRGEIGAGGGVLGGAAARAL
eukprot:scaffold10113_cov150-Isochrysis_galbana.AAC.1